jgi:hypothetical protein
VVYYVRNQEEKSSVVVAFSVTLAILFVIGICIAVKPYFDKVSSTTGMPMYPYFDLILFYERNEADFERGWKTT